MPDIELHYGEAVWVMAELGFRGHASHSTFYQYLKSLRKFGIPFRHKQLNIPSHGLATYTYCRLMEFALVLTLRVYYPVPDSVLAGVIRYRARLYRLYERAYAERSSGIGAVSSLKPDGSAPIRLRGLFVDLGMRFSDGRLVRFGPPKALSPIKALSIYAARDVAARAFLPINLSCLAERLIETSLRAPIIRRRWGRRRLRRPSIK